MRVNPITLLGNSYANYVREIVLPNGDTSLKDISYWRNEIFLKMLIFLAPVSIVALVPSVIISFVNGIPVLGFADLIAFALVVMLMVNRRIPLRQRKFIFVLTFYILSVIILYYLDKPGPGLLFLLTSTILSAVIYSALAGYYSAWANVFICICFGICILAKVNIPIVADYSLGTWVAISCTVAFISFLCAECLKFLLNGLETSLDSAKTVAANLSSIIESTDAPIYSLDTEFRYITFNQALKNGVKRAYNVDIKPGDKAFDFLETTLPEEALFWKNIYNEALAGKPILFEKDFNIGSRPSTVSFLVSAIVKTNEVIGLSCFAADITERKNAQRKIQQLNEELETKVMERTAQLAASNKELEAFSYSVSHDLRAPLRAVNGYAKMLKEDYGARLPADAGRVVNNIMDHAQKMGQLIDGLLTFSRFGQKELVMGHINIEDMVKSVCSELKKEGTGRPVQFIINQLAPAYGDRIAIKQVWANLILNAVKYTGQKQKPVISIGSQIKENEIVYYIKDNGAGFDMRYADKLFGVFQRLHADEEFEGNGIGLAMVHRIISKHGGRIWAEAKVNEGAAFYFTLQ